MASLSIRFLCSSVAAALLAVMLFLPGLGGGFIFDDKPNIVENTSLHVQGGAGLEDMLYATYSFQPGNGSRALTMFSFAVDYWRGGLDPRTFKSTNLLIHALTTLALALFCRQLFLLAGWAPKRAAIGAFLLALLWAAHPLQVSSVLYVVQRMQTLVTLFMVLAMYSYVRMRCAQIDGERSRLHGVLTLLFWVLGLASKEDALLFPAYTFLLELVFFHFRAATPLLSKVLRNCYLLMVVIGGLLFVLWVMPHYWQLGAYPGRNFSSYERLLTQGRVLVMYLGQVLWPAPSSMPFYYDDLLVSRGLLQPPGTLVALLVLGFLLLWAWGWRNRRPLFAFGILFFFAGHFMTSNVLNLELAFEHRNQLPMIGILFALVDLSRSLFAWASAKGQGRFCLLVFTGVLLVVSSATVVRAWQWGEPLRFAEASVAISPHSERAWLQLGNVYAERSGLDPQNPNFSRALDVCRRGAEVTGSAPLWSNVVIYKTITGSVEAEDWKRLTERMREVPMSAQNQNVLWAMLGNVDRGMVLDEEGMLQLIDVVSAKSALSSSQYFRLAAYIHNETHSPGRALQYLRLAMQASAPGDQQVAEIFDQLEQAGRHDWVVQLKQIILEKEKG